MNKFPFQLHQVLLAPKQLVADLGGVVKILSNIKDGVFYEKS